MACCNKTAEWFGTFLVGAWRMHVPLCAEHVRTFALMVEALEKSGVPSAGMPVQILVVAEIYSLSQAGDRYQLARQLWECSECGLPIVRSLESGSWVLAGSPNVREKVDMALHPHEHVPG